MKARAFSDVMDMAVFYFTIAAGIFAIGFGLGESNMAHRIRAQAECPGGDYYMKVLDLAKMEVRCRYYRKGSTR